MNNPVPQLAQALVRKFINEPTYMQGVTDAVTMIRSNVKLPRVRRPRNIRYNRKGKHSIAHLDVEQLVSRRSVGSTEFWSSGHFSTCFRHASAYGQEYAIKISLRVDDGAVPYYRWVYANKLWLSNYHFPEIQFVGKVAGFDVTVMEWLPDGWGEWDDDEYYAACGIDEAVNYESKHEELVKAGQELREFEETAGYHFDIHRENLRRRDDGTLVICDPLSFKIREHWS